MQSRTFPNCHSDSCVSSDRGSRSEAEDGDVEEGANTAAPGNMEDMTRDSCGQEEGELRGGALGSSTTQKKKQVAEAVQQMDRHTSSSANTTRPTR